MALAFALVEAVYLAFHISWKQQRTWGRLYEWQYSQDIRWLHLSNNRNTLRLRECRPNPNGCTFRHCWCVFEIQLPMQGSHSLDWLAINYNVLMY